MAIRLSARYFLNRLVGSLDDYVDEFGCTLGEELLKPTRIYVKSVLAALKQFDVKGLAHITGGGFIENIPRMLPEGLGAELKREAGKFRQVFKTLESLGRLERQDMYNIFNMGIGMVLLLIQDAPEVLRLFNENGEIA